MNLRRLVLALGVVVILPTLGRSQTADVQGRIPLSLKEAIAALKDANSEERAYAAYSLAQLGPMAVDAIPALIAVLKNDACADVRADTARALGRIGTSSPTVLPPLRQALKDNDPWVRIRAAESIGLLSPADEAAAVAIVLRCLADSRRDELDSIPGMVFDSLRQLGPRAKGCGKEIVPWLADPNFTGYVLSALEEIDEDAGVVVPGLMAVLVHDHLADRVRIFGMAGRACLTSLVTGRITDEADVVWKVGVEMRILTKDERASRRMAIGMLGRYGSKAADAVPLLTKCLEDRGLRKDAAQALAKIQGTR